jgi:hypothetical protein
VVLRNQVIVITETTAEIVTVEIADLVLIEDPALQDRKVKTVDQDLKGRIENLVLIEDPVLQDQKVKTADLAKKGKTVDLVQTVDRALQDQKGKIVQKEQHP